MSTWRRAAAVLIAVVAWIGGAVGQTTAEKGIGSARSSGTAMATLDEPFKTTLCELMSNPLRFAGRAVEVHATLAGNFEMSVLVDDSCPHSDVVIWYGRGLVATDTSQYAFIDSIDAMEKPDDIGWRPPAPVIFHPTNDSKKMFEYIRKHKKGGDVTVTATFTGRFDYIPKLLALKASDGKVTAVSAFGHQNCCSARLEPQSVTEFVLPKK
jgi:hypothetical protein